MTKTAVNKTKDIAAEIIRSPLLWGTLGSVAFYWLIHSHRVTDPRVIRYFASHPVEYIATTMFFVGLASLVLRGIDLLLQFERLKQPLLGSVPSGGQPLHECGALLKRLAELPANLQRTYLVRRLRDGLEHVRRKGTADTLDDELKYLAESDAARAHANYALVRIIIWAIPILGFLGTVIGITLAIAKLAPEALENSLPEVTAGLGVAFDTTALALALSMLLMFAQFVAERFETRLLATVDERVSDELAGRFESFGTGGDPHLIAIRRMADAVLQATERVVHRQGELWQTTIDAAHHRWHELTDTTGRQLEAALRHALEQSLAAYAERLDHSASRTAEENRKHWDQVQAALVRTAEAMSTQQEELRRQGEILLSVVEASGQVSQLEATLNRNLSALAGSQNFEETLVSLAAATQLLSARLSGNAVAAPQVDLKNKRPTSHAA